MKHLIILSIALSSAGTAFAERSSFRDRSENWLQRENTETTSGNLRDGSIDLSDNPENNPNNRLGVIGESLGLLLGASMLYGANVFGRKKK